MTDIKTKLQRPGAQSSRKGAPPAAPALVPAATDVLKKPSSSTDVSLGVKVSPEFRKRLKSFAVVMDTDMKSVIIEAVEKLMKEKGGI
jgi:hypothetical protein